MRRAASLKPQRPDVQHLFVIFQQAGSNFTRRLCAPLMVTRARAVRRSLPAANLFLHFLHFFLSAGPASSDCPDRLSKHKQRWFTIASGLTIQMGGYSASSARRRRIDAASENVIIAIIDSRACASFSRNLTPFQRRTHRELSSSTWSGFHVVPVRSTERLRQLCRAAGIEVPPLRRACRCGQTALYAVLLFRFRAH